MSWWDGMLHRFRSIVFQRREQAELREEIEFHLECDRSQGHSRTQARQRFGNVTAVREDVRSGSWGGRLDVLRQDLGHVVRVLRRDRSVTALMIATLALGIGANVAVFSLLDRIFLRFPAGVADAGSLRRVWTRHFRTGDGKPFSSMALTFPGYRGVAAATGAPERFAIYTWEGALHLGAGLKGPKVRVGYASSNLAGIIGLSLQRGRWYLSSEDSLGASSNVTVVSDRFWRVHLGGTPKALSETVAIGHDRYRVIGVLAPDFVGLDDRIVDLWIPIAAKPQPKWLGPRWWESDNNAEFRAVVRWSPDWSAGALAAKVTDEARRRERQTRGRQADTLQTVSFGPLIEAQGPADLGSDIRIAIRLAGVALIVLVIALANVVNLLLIRSEERRREQAVQLALGIGRARLMRLWALETVVLACAAGVAASVLGGLGGAFLKALLFPITDWTGPTVDGRVGWFAAGVTLLAGFAAGLPLTVEAKRHDPMTALKAGTRQAGAASSVVGRGLLAAQVALSVVLLAGASLSVKSLLAVRDLDLGFDAGQLVVGSVDHAAGEAPLDEVWAVRVGDIDRRLRDHPAIEAVGRTSMEPMWGFSADRFFADRDSAESFGPPAYPTFVRVTSGFFGAAGLRFLAGRPLSGGEASFLPEVVVNDAMAKLVWAGRDPMGQCLRMQRRTAPCHTVVGVVENSRMGSVIEPVAAPIYYLPLRASDSTGHSAGHVLIVRPRAGKTAVAIEAVRAELAAQFPAGLPDVRTLTGRLGDEYRPWRLGATLFSVLGGLALIVASIGIYSVVAFAIRRRTREFGIRIALGAAIRHLIRVVAAQVGGPLALGLVVGLAICIGGGRLLAGMLYQVKPTDPLALGLVVLALGLAAIAATARPIRRASRVDPAIVLRDE